jgi:hypothetical protein
MGTNGYTVVVNAGIYIFSHLPHFLTGSKLSVGFIVEYIMFIQKKNVFELGVI